MSESYRVHGEIIKDGDASGGETAVLYDSGGTTVRTLASTEFLHITSLFVNVESGGDVSLVADSKAAGRYIVHGNLPENGIIEHNVNYRCPRGKVPKFFGAAENLNVVLFEGYIVEG